LLSPDSIHSEMLGFEIESAHEASQLQQGRPSLLPLRVNYTGPLPEPLASILDPLQYYLWESEHDNLGLATELAEALKHLPPVEPADAASSQPAASPAVPAQRPPPKPSTSVPRPAALEAIGGAVPLDSQFYVTRQVDTELTSSISKSDSIVLIKGVRQMG